MQDRYPLTVVQLRQTMEDLQVMKAQADEISRLLSAEYGDAHPRAIRAGEVSGSIQRLLWELERGALSATA